MILLDKKNPENSLGTSGALDAPVSPRFLLTIITSDQFI